jgi:hypothetical protein
MIGARHGSCHPGRAISADFTPPRGGIYTVADEPLSPHDWSFEELATRCGAVLWLVPEAAELWGSGGSALGAYLPHVDVAVEARDLLGLSRGVGELMRRL